MNVCSGSAKGDFCQSSPIGVVEQTAAHVGALAQGDPVARSYARCVRADRAVQPDPAIAPAAPASPVRASPG
ncbi:hypothetical protein SCWH03_05910 [Streptomyces pacificus]|uniref:Uncharacterized protein n=1 Tax=Streptomyces pacificus TaxID=2705029 RepID=A0A6A0AS32_9ACTN|nr:hypothetical protein SCWH03_05910 [Streptomyces pacificus]